jgi:O-antigen ligase
MLTSDFWLPSFRLKLKVAIGGAIVGLAAGFLAGAQPLYLGLAIGSVIAVVYFFTNFNRSVMGLLVLRSFLDIFSAQQIPAVFAIGVDALTLLYVFVLLLTQQTIYTDRFWWFFASWVAFQGLWLLFMPLGGLGLDASFLPISVREWTRLFSWLMVYLLVMQLKDKLPPEKVISWLFFALILPLVAASMQMLLPPSLLPSVLVAVRDPSSIVEEISRINGTLGHPNTFATFLLLFIALTYWKLLQTGKNWFWVLLLALLAVFYVSTKALFSIVMLAIFVLVLIAPRLSLVNLLGGLLLLAIAIGLFASNPFGQERLNSIAQTPLLNPDIDLSRAILLSKSDNNSFNWRLAQWTYLLQQWQEYPSLGYGVGTSAYVSTNGLYPHNDYIRALVEGGIVGFISYLLFFIVQIVHLVRLTLRTAITKAQRNLYSILLATLIAINVGMITENIWSHTTFFFYWWTLLAIAGWHPDKWQKPSIPVPSNF